jgi:acetolactate synthase-1/2/3 large subunit
VPLIVVTGQDKRPDRMRGAPLRQKGVQEVDIVPMVRSITKYAVTVEDPLEIRRHLDMALFLACEGRQGPVWIDVPLDVQGAPIDPRALEGWSPPAGPRPDPTAAVEATLALLAGASRPLLLAGHGVRLAGAASVFRSVVDALGIPVTTTWNALDLLPHEHPALVGRPGAVAVRAPNFAVQNCDALLAIGARLDNVVTAYNPRQFARHAKKLVVDVDRNELARHELPDCETFEADAREFLEVLRAKIDAPLSRPEWMARCQRWKARWTRLDGETFPTQGPIGHSHVTDALAEAIPDDTLIVTGSSGLAVEAFYLGFRNRPGQRVFLTSGLGAMGYGLPASIGAGVAHGRRLVLVESDGSMQLNVQELATISALRMPVVIFLLDNAGYASIRNTQRGYFEGRYVGTGPEAGLAFPDWLALARAYGIEAMNVSNVTELSRGLAAALAHPGPILCRIQLVHDETLWPRVASKPQRDGSMLTMPLEDMTPLLSLEALQAEMIVPLSAASVKAREA